MRLLASMLAGLCLLALPGPSQAAGVEAAATVATAGPPPLAASDKKVQLASRTQLKVEIVAPLSSAASNLGDKVALRLLAPISSDRVDVVAAGAMSEGEVIDASPARIAGRAGKLVLPGGNGE